MGDTALFGRRDDVAARLLQSALGEQAIDFGAEPAHPQAFSLQPQLAAHVGKGGSEQTGHGAESVAGGPGGLADGVDLERLLALARAEHQGVARHPGPTRGGQYGAGALDRAGRTVAGQGDPPGSNAAALEGALHHAGQERRQLRVLAGPAQDLQLLGGEQGEAGGRRLLPLHGSQIGEARLPSSRHHQQALAEVGRGRQKGREIRVPRRPGEDEQGLAPQLVEPGGKGREAGPHLTDCGRSDCGR